MVGFLSLVRHEYLLQLTLIFFDIKQCVLTVSDPTIDMLFHKTSHYLMFDQCFRVNLHKQSHKLVHSQCMFIMAALWWVTDCTLIITTHPSGKGQMIIDIGTPSVVKAKPLKHSWQYQLKQDLYQLNEQAITRHREAHHDNHRSEKQRQAEKTLKKLFKSSDQSREQVIKVRDSHHASRSHAYYSSFIPLQMQTQFDDELTCTFPYLRYLHDKGRSGERNSILDSMAEYMKRCREQGSVEAGWQETVKVYLCPLDSVKAIELFLHLKKHGVSTLIREHRQLAYRCKFPVFLQRITDMERFFKVKQMLHKTKVLSVDVQDQINEVSMPKTMKNLFCGICLIYDCVRHSLDPIIAEKSYQYVAPENQVSPREHMEHAVLVCRVHEELTTRGKVTSPQLLDNPCSSKCFTLLKEQEWRKIQNTRSKVLSPMVKGLIKLGIELYSFSPCDIWNLLIGCHQKQTTPISCSHVFLFFIEEYNLLQRINLKLYATQADQLRRESQTERQMLPEMRRRRRKLRPSGPNKDQSTNIVSTCSHYFIGEEPTDANCENCQCRERDFCLPQCLCRQDCPLRKLGCRCKRDECRTSRCECYKNNMECDPLLCRNCFGDDKKNSCRNCQIMMRQFKKVRVGQSTIPMAGLGLFAAESIGKDELVMIYSGELIDHYTDVLRENCSVDNTFYNFGSIEGTIDARFMGNLSRFINHGDQGRDNLSSVNKLTQGRYKIGFYAMRDIEEEQELFFDYDGEGTLYENFREKYPFINSKKKHQKKAPTTS